MSGEGTEDTLLTGQENTDGAGDDNGEGAADGNKGDGAADGEGADGEGAGDDGNKGDGEGGEGEGDGEGSEGAPEKYEDFTMPEGVEPDTALMEKAVPLFKDLNLTQEQAQKAVDLLAEARANDAKALQESLATARAQWVADAKADKELGGAAFKENMATAKKAFDAFGSPELKEMLNASGFGDHPAVLKTFFKIGKALSDDSLVLKDGDTNEEDSLDGFYDRSDHKRAGK
jgi:hypothetical protein